MLRLLLRQPHQGATQVLGTTSPKTYGKTILCHIFLNGKFGSQDPFFFHHHFHKYSAISIFFQSFSTVTLNQNNPEHSTQLEKSLYLERTSGLSCSTDQETAACFGTTDLPYVRLCFSWPSTSAMTRKTMNLSS